ncbi:ABC transporter permease [Lipingzhangella sp. LS1_29]|uniref:Transport permease protein n=1 Tax=Lipingzhangella rawalii TaxID=2055835 RepID=A0ABU2HBP5_9ACTN|nr:ABC transporter permease [Lipingzhangella rawalii]MDS1272235.1 ABC transporter permease [Lipingzhangella rawalii]
MTSTDRPTPAQTRPGAAELPGTLRVGVSRSWLEIREFFREWETVLFTFAFPTLILLLFSAIFADMDQGPQIHMQATEFYLPGLIAMALMSVSFQTLGVGIATERDNGTLRRLRGTPMPPAAYFLGKTGMVLLLALGQLILLLGVARIGYGADLPVQLGDWLTITWVFVLGTVACSLLGIACSSLARSARGASVIVIVPFLVLQFFSGVFIPVQALPDWVVNVAAVFPLKWMAQGMRSAFYPESAAALEPSGAWDLHLVLAVLAVWCVVGVILCLLTFRWKTAKDG